MTVTVWLPSAATRDSSVNARAGTIRLTGTWRGLESSACLTDTRKPSVAARVICWSSTEISTPCRMGRASSWEAANATWAIISLKSATAMSSPSFRSGTGIGGKSWASMPLISVVELPQRTLSVWVRGLRVSATASLGRVLTRSTIVRAGTVMEPSSVIWQGIQQVMPSSRLVALRRRRPSSVASSTLPSTGKVVRGATARETMLRPRASSC